MHIGAVFPHEFVIQRGADVRDFFRALENEYADALGAARASLA